MNPPVALVAVDHVVILSRDPDATIAGLWERTGLRTLPGGEHVGLGTRNWIVPLGGGYLEIVEVWDPELAAGNGFGQLALAGLARAVARAQTDCLQGWAAVVPSVAATATALDSPVLPLRRDGVEVLLCGLERAEREPALPFFLERAATDARPGQRAAPHRVHPTGFAALRATASGSVDTTLPPGPTELHVSGGAPELSMVEISVDGGANIVLTANDPMG